MGRPGAWLVCLLSAAGCGGAETATLGFVTSAELKGSSGTIYESPADTATRRWMRERFNVIVTLRFEGGPCSPPAANVAARVNGVADRWRAGGVGRFGCDGWVFGFDDVPPGDGTAPATVRATIEDGVGTVDVEADLFEGTRATLVMPADGTVRSTDLVTVDFAVAKPLKPPGTARLVAQVAYSSPEQAPTATVVVGQSAVATVQVVAPPGPNKLYLDARFADAPIALCSGVAACRAIPSPALGPFDLEILQGPPAPPQF